MALTLTWDDVLLRLVLAIVAGMVLGLDRGERGEPAGMRTTALVSLAAAAAMIAGNLLLPTTVPTPDSLVSLDIMGLLPLGILSGMGFIGAGAIVRRGESVQGLATAATLWCATVIGICIGAGLIVLGVASALAAFLLLSAVKVVEGQLPSYRRAKLVITASDSRVPNIGELRRLAGDTRLHLRGVEVVGGDNATVEMSVVWRDRGEEDGPPAFVVELSRRPGVTSVLWET